VLSTVTDRPFAPPLNSSVVVELPGEPRAKGRPRFGNGHAFTPQATRNYENDLRFMAKRAMQGRVLFEGPVRVEILALFSVPKSWSKIKQVRALMHTIRPTGKPDLDNIFKVVDALNGIVWRDDSQVVNATIIKKYSDQPRLRIEVEAMIGEGA